MDGILPLGYLTRLQTKKGLLFTGVLIFLKFSASTLPQEGHLKFSMMFSSLFLSVPHISFQLWTWLIDQ